MRLVRWAARILAVVGAIYLYFALWHPRERVPDHVYFDKPGPWVIAHQGGKGLWPENTLYAFERALELGVDVLETDVHATADGVIVVMHDDTVDRTTDGTGRVDSMTFSEIRALDAAYRFQDAAGGFPFRGQGLQAPTLEEVLARFGQTRFVIEMKEFTPELAVQLCRQIETSGAADRVLIGSFSYEPMAAFRESCPSVATSATTREAAMFYVFHRMKLASLYRGPAVAIQVPEEAAGQSVVDPGFLELARDLNLAVQVWTVNEVSDMERLLEMDVQGIITDYPDRLLQVMERVPR